jgi:Ca-activated chloride channel family protein
MNLSQFNFQNVVWLWAILLIPILFIIQKITQKITEKINKKYSRPDSRNLERFADRHLLPFLTKKPASVKKLVRKSFLLVPLLWTLGILALAGPRWDFKNIQSYKAQKNLVILLDLSDSMDAEDVKPSRLIRARQKIDDVLNENPDLSAGLVGFAEDAHLISPITEDRNTIRHLLGVISTDLVSVQGSRLAPALAMADRLLVDAPGKDKAVLILSDGEWEDSDLSQSLKQLTSHGIKVSSMGFGTVEGAPISGRMGEQLKSRGEVILSRLDQPRLAKVSALGNGNYYYQNDEVKGGQLFSSSLGGNDVQLSNLIAKDWEPRFYVFLIPFLLLMLPLFRRKISSNQNVLNAAVTLLLVSGIAISMTALASEPINLNSAAPSVVSRLFKNREILGKDSLEARDFQAAAQQFKDPYHRGVAQYRAGEFSKAESSFRESKRPEVATASLYNLGNSLAEQAKYAEAIQSYEEVLKKDPHHLSAQANLKRVQELLKKEQQQQQRGQDQKPKQNQDQKQAQGEKLAQGEKQGQGEKQAQGEKQGQGALPDGAHHQTSEAPDKSAKNSQQDIDADVWLNRISNDPHTFLKNQFLIESAHLHTQNGERPW